MRFYNQRHEFYCGIDLHANSMHVCVVDHEGGKQLHRNFETRTPERFLQALDPYRDRDLIVGCESTFNWYWLADLCSVQNVAFLLGHALYLKAIHGGKTKTDRIDPEKRTGIISTAVFLKEQDGSNDTAQRRDVRPCTSEGNAPPLFESGLMIQSVLVDLFR